MVRQDELAPAPGSKHRRKRVGRGDGSGHGSFSGRGSKGQKARSGDPKVRPGFEGGQLPLIKRLPHKRGFTNIFKVRYATVNISSLDKFEPGAEITPEKLWKAGLIDSPQKPVKILGGGEVNHPWVVKANYFSASAKEKIEAAGGRVEEIKIASAKAG